MKIIPIGINWLFMSIKVVYLLYINSMLFGINNTAALFV